MTLPRELKLYKEEDDYFLRSMPVGELASLESGSIEIDTKSVQNGSITSAISPTSKLEISFKKPTSGLVSVRFSNEVGEYLDIGYDADKRIYFANRTHAGKHDFSSNFAGKHTGQALYNHDNVDMLIYLDHASVELFADGGQCVMTEIFFPTQPFTSIELRGELLSGKLRS